MAPTDTWLVVDTLFRDEGLHELVRHQYETYNVFVGRQIEDIIAGFNPVTVPYKFNDVWKRHEVLITLEFKSPVLSRPLIFEKDGSSKIMTPYEARRRNFTYSAGLHCTVEVCIGQLNQATGAYVNTHRTFRNVPIGKVPVMVGSDYCVTRVPGMRGVAERQECPYDVGGYFIINGAEKVIISQDRVQENKTFVFPNSKGGAYSMVAEIRSVADNVFSPPKLTVLKLSGTPNEYGNYVRVSMHHVRIEVPLFTLFRALGVLSDRAIIEAIAGPRRAVGIEALAGSIVDGNVCYTQVEALEYIARHVNMGSQPKELFHDLPTRVAWLRQVLAAEFLPHVGEDFGRKAQYLGHMARKLLTSTEASDDRDSYANKRVDTPGVLLAGVFRQYVGKMVKECKKMVLKELHTSGAFSTGSLENVVNKHNITRIVKSIIIDSGLKYALSTGIWGLKNNKNSRNGVAQVLNRMSYYSTVSHLRRINTPVEKNGKLVQPRRLHPTQWGIVCPAETPEGASVGVVKNMALTALITVHAHSGTVRDIVAAGLGAGWSEGSCLVFVNGDPVGYHPDPAALYAELKRAKRSGGIGLFTSIYWNHADQAMHISTEAGRCVRPLYVVESGQLVVKEDHLEDLRAGRARWAELVMDPEGRSAIEYLDVLESNNARVAMTEEELRGPDAARFTHMELHPSLILGVLACSIPFPDHNQSPRNSYQCLSPDEPVLMADGALRAIRDVRPGDEVVTFHPMTMKTSVSRVVHQYVRHTDKAVYEVRTQSGRAIRATYDHKFMTDQGWLPVERFVPGVTRVGVLPHPRPVSASLAVDNVVLWPGEVAPGVPPTTILKSDPRLPALARVFGYAFSWQKQQAFMRPAAVRFASEADAEEFAADARLVVPDVQVCGRCVGTEGALGVLLDLLAERIEDWFDQGSPLIRREYLAGLLGRMEGGDNGGRRAATVYYELGVESPADDVAFMDAVGYRYNQYRTKAHAVVAEQARGGGELTTRGPMLFVPVASVVHVPDVRVIADITVESDNHSFIGGAGFAVSNSAMGKQAIGVYISNFRERLDTLAHVLNYPQRPLVATRASRLLCGDVLPNGMNAIVAIATYTGFNQEDAIIVNRSALERGLFNSTFYRTFREQNNKNHATGEEEVFCNPVKQGARKIKPYNYGKLGADGFVPENTFVTDADIIIGKCMPQKTEGVIEFRDVSVSMKNGESGFVDRNVANNNVTITTNGDGYDFAKVRVRSFRMPVIGDKLASRHAQKGTMGIMYPQEDMPFTADGLVPDIIINPHAMPSRMTVGQLLECIMGKAGCVMGAFGDGTPFMGVTAENVAARLRELGFEGMGNEVLYSGRTGEQIKTDIFIGPTFYQRLKHMTADKTHSRAGNGPLVSLTRQPAEGRSREGGLRIGEMEVQCMWAHGTFDFLKERFMDCSDHFRVFVCKGCNRIATTATQTGACTCRSCKTTTEFAQVHMPFAYKLLMQEVQALGIETKLLTTF